MLHGMSEPNMGALGFKARVSYSGKLTVQLLHQLLEGIHAPPEPARVLLRQLEMLRATLLRHWPSTIFGGIKALKA